ncbi:hypothetical protein LY78DRAFT_173762 [Colletotrichum sublineola]|nr:hypothetical protein LY78DRAFT_173762 [Colletotrichum sublineola]
MRGVAFPPSPSLCRYGCVLGDSTILTSLAAVAKTRQHRKRPALARQQFNAQLNQPLAMPYGRVGDLQQIGAVDQHSSQVVPCRGQMMSTRACLVGHSGRGPRVRLSFSHAMRQIQDVGLELRVTIEFTSRAWPVRRGARFALHQPKRIIGQSSVFDDSRPRSLPALGADRVSRESPGSPFGNSSMPSARPTEGPSGTLQKHDRRP